MSSLHHTTSLRNVRRQTTDFSPLGPPARRPARGAPSRRDPGQAFIVVRMLALFTGRSSSVASCRVGPGHPAQARQRLPDARRPNNCPCCPSSPGLPGPAPSARPPRAPVRPSGQACTRRLLRAGWLGRRHRRRLPLPSALLSSAASRRRARIAARAAIRPPPASTTRPPTSSPPSPLTFVPALPHITGTTKPSPPPPPTAPPTHLAAAAAAINSNQQF